MEKHEEVVGVVWAVVLVQGAITLLSLFEALAIGVALGVPLVHVLALTGAGTAMALSAARGLRQKKRWARRLTLTAESLILALGIINALASLALSGHLSLMPFLTTIAAPLVVILMLRRTKPLFAEPIAEGGA